MCIGLVFDIIKVAQEHETWLTLIGYGFYFIFRIFSIVSIKNFMAEVLEDETSGRIYAKLP